MCTFLARLGLTALVSNFISQPLKGLNETLRCWKTRKENEKRGKKFLYFFPGKSNFCCKFLWRFDLLAMLGFLKRIHKNKIKKRSRKKLFSDEKIWKIRNRKWKREGTLNAQNGNWKKRRNQYMWGFMSQGWKLEVKETEAKLIVSISESFFPPFPSTTAP